MVEVTEAGEAILSRPRRSYIEATSTHIRYSIIRPLMTVNDYDCSSTCFEQVNSRCFDQWLSEFFGPVFGSAAQILVKKVKKTQIKLQPKTKMKTIFGRS